MCIFCFFGPLRTFSPSCANFQRFGSKAAVSGKHENIRNQADRLDEDDMAQWRRRQELYRAYDGPVAPGMMARAGDGEARLVQLI
jgi:hypothetical protein